MTLCRYEKVVKKNILLAALKNQTSHGSPWLLRAQQSMRDKQWSESSDWQGLKWINTRPFSVLFFQITVIGGETHFNCIQTVWMDFFSSLALYELQQLDDLFSECSVSTGGLFQHNLAQHLFCYCLRDSRLHVGLSSSFELFENHKQETFFQEIDIQFPFPNTSDFYLHSKHFKHLGKQFFLKLESMHI